MAKVADSSTTKSTAVPRLSRVQHANFRGPVRNRQCTDVVCLAVFFAFLAGWAYVAYFAFSNGVLARITHPVDSRGQICGLDKAANRTFLFYFDLAKCASPAVLIAGCLTPSICVENCPNTAFGYLQVLDPFNPLIIDTSRLICVDDFNKSALTSFDKIQEAVILGRCAAYYLPSGPVGGRCMPGFRQGPNGQTETLFNEIPADHLIQSLNSSISIDDVFQGSSWMSLFVQTQQAFMNIAHDFTQSWKIILLWFGFSVVLSLLWMFLLRWIAGVVIWVSLAGMLGGLGYGIYFSYAQYESMSSNSWFNLTNSTKGPPNADSLNHLNSGIKNVTLDLQKLKNIHNGKPDAETWLILCIACAAAAVIVLLITLFLRKRIRMALAIIRVSSRAIGQMTTTVFFPLVPLILQLVTVAICGSCALWLAATGNPEGVIVDSTETVHTGLRNNDSCNPNHKTPECIRVMPLSLLRPETFTNLFGFFWGMAFADALCQIVLSGAFASYYWAFEKPQNVPLFPVLASFYRSIRYHLGSLAFGSLLVASVQIIQAVLKYLQRKLKHGNNFFTRFVIKICTCCFYCLEKCIKFLNRYAYIMIAIFGKGFCPSAKDAFLLLVRNAIRVAVVDGVVSFFMFLGKIGIMGAMGYSVYSFCTGAIPHVDEYVPRMYYVYVPVVTVVIGSYIISSIFFGVYTMAVDTMFLCFREYRTLQSFRFSMTLTNAVEDLERNDGSVEKPYYMSKSLMEIFGKKTTFPAAQPSKIA